MPIKSDAQRRAVAKYNAQNYERLEIRVPKGMKSTIKAHADGRQESVNAFVGRAIREAISRDNAQQETR